ncbi:TOBE domain-containing protein [Nocardia sp. CA-084685]|uniref:TOBE domain-containing protein n=1 Tax=Nocardia sp. CA-084685 TaxID=3239970 RepID=UPI003D98BFC2
MRIHGMTRLGLAAISSVYTDHADITPGAVAELDLAPGRSVYFAVEAAEVQVYPC